MIVDSFRFLPRSFRAMYESPDKLEHGPVWAEFRARLSDARIALLTSGGLHLAGEQDPFDLEREKREPLWGDPSYRVIPAGTTAGRFGMCHLHVNNAEVLADPEIALPLGHLAELAEAGTVGSVAPSHVSVMGYQESSLAGWRDDTGPAIVELLEGQGTDGLILAPV